MSMYRKKEKSIKSHGVHEGDGAPHAHPSLL